MAEHRTLRLTGFTVFLNVCSTNIVGLWRIPDVLRSLVRVAQKVPQEWGLQWYAVNSLIETCVVHGLVKKKKKRWLIRASGREMEQMSGGKCVTSAIMMQQKWKFFPKRKPTQHTSHQPWNVTISTGVFKVPIWLLLDYVSVISAWKFMLLRVCLWVVHIVFGGAC